MTDLARRPVRAMMQAAAEYNGGAYAGIQADQNEVVRARTRR